jgi:hypothetical protein
MKPNVRISCRQSLAVSLIALTVFTGLITPATAGGGDVAAGVLGGLAVGALVGSAASQPRYYAPYYAPAPVYVPAPRCWLEHERVWDGYGYVIQRVRVCE